MSSNDFLLSLRDDLHLINDLTYTRFWRSPKTLTCQISNDGAIQIRQMANKFELQIIQNFNIGIKNTKAS